MIISIGVIKCFSDLAEDASYVLGTGCVAWAVKVFHDAVKADWYLLVFLHIAASELGILLTEEQWLLGLEWRLVVQTLGVTATPPGLEEQRQDEEKEVREEGVLQIRGHGAEDAVLQTRIVQFLIQLRSESKQLVCGFFSL